MAALDAGCARTLRPQRYTYALIKGRASSKNVFTPLVFLSLTPFLAPLPPSFLINTTLHKPFLSPTYHRSIIVFISG